jgi:FtsP/CotA-like multicopper oxidase with cupredoxin domain
MSRIKKFFLLPMVMFFLLVGAFSAWAQVVIQCPGDLNGDGIPDPFLFRPNGTPGNQPNPAFDPNVRCIHLAAGDGFINMADGYLQYTFGFSDVTGHTADMVMMEGMLKAELPAPTIKLKQGQKLYLTLTNVGMMMRPDLFDPHSVHWHGFPNASAIFDGEPMASISINMGSSLTYFYNVVEPGTFMYHCHVEATEHMQMGMLGNLYVTPAQDGALVGGCASMKYAYNDSDGSTCYDMDYPVQIHAFDPDFHDASMNVQPLPFAAINDRYGMLNGRGYPDTINTAQLGQSADNNNHPSQKVNTLITATSGQKILLRISNLSFDYYTLTVLGIPMKVVGKDAKLLRGPTGLNLYYTTNSVDLGGGETTDVILDTAGISAGRYFLYTSNLNYLSNNAQERGGIMTEIVVN